MTRLRFACRYKLRCCPARVAKAAVRWGPRYQPVFVRPDGLDLEYITKLIEEGELRPVVDRVFKLEDARCFCDMLRARSGVQGQR